VNFILGGIILLTLFVLMMKSNFFRNIGRARWIRFPLAFPITTIVAVLLIGWNLLLLLLQTSTTADPDAASIWNQSANFITRPLGFFVIISAIRYVGMEVNSQTAKTA